MRDKTKIVFACLKHCAPGKKANRGDGDGDGDEPRLTAVTDGQARAANPLTDGCHLLGFRRRIPEQDDVAAYSRPSFSN